MLRKRIKRFSVRWRRVRRGSRRNRAVYTRHLMAMYQNVIKRVGQSSHQRSRQTARHGRPSCRSGVVQAPVPT